MGIIIDHNSDEIALDILLVSGENLNADINNIILNIDNNNMENKEEGDKKDLYCILDGYLGVSILNASVW